MPRIRISAPQTSVSGEIIELKALIEHPMETGFRRDALGQVIPRDILTDFECVYGGETVFKARFFPAVAANPFLTFFTRATISGDLEFRWTSQSGEVFSQTVSLTVA